MGIAKGRISTPLSVAFIPANEKSVAFCGKMVYSSEKLAQVSSAYS